MVSENFNKIFSRTVRIARLAAAVSLLALGLSARADSRAIGEYATVNTKSAVHPTSGFVMAPWGNLVYSDSQTNTVREILSDGTVFDRMTPGFTLKQPSGLAVGGSTALYVADTGNNRVIELVGATQAHQVSIGALYGPNALATDELGNLYVVAAASNAIMRVSSAGPAPLGTGGISLLHAQAAAYDHLNGTLYITCGQDNYVVVIPAPGSANPKAYKLNLGSSITLSNPTGITVDAAGNLYIVDAGHNRVVELQGGSVSAISTQGLVDAKAPAAIVVGFDGTEYLANAALNSLVRIAQFSNNFGTFNLGTTSDVRVIGFSTTNAPATVSAAVYEGAGVVSSNFQAGALKCAAAGGGYSTCFTGVSFAPTQAGVRAGTLALLDQNKKILASMPVYGVGWGGQAIFPNTSAARPSIGGTVPGASPALALDSGGTLYMADTAHNRILMLANGVSSVVSTPGFSLSSPGGVAVDPAGNLFIADTGNGRVLERLASGTTQMVSLAPYLLYSPTGVALDGAGNLLIADNVACSILMKSVTGTAAIVYKANAGVHIAHLAVDSYDNIYYVPSNMGLVVEVFPNGSASVLESPNDIPGGIAVDAATNVYYTDTAAGMVHILWMGQGPSAALAMSGAGFNQPSGIALDKAGDIYVSDASASPIVLEIRSIMSAFNFGSTTVGATSATMPVTIENLGTGNMQISSVPVTAGFNLAGDPTQCGVAGSVGSDISCTLKFTFTPASAGSAAGSASVQYAGGFPYPTPIYFTGFGVGTQTINFTLAQPTVTYGASPITLSATASSGLPVTFWLQGGPASLKCNVLTITGTGAVTIVATQAGNANWAPANMTQYLWVNPATLTLTAKSYSFPQGSILPNFAYTVSGLVNGDVQAKAYTGQPLLTSTGNSTAPGSFPIVISKGTLQSTNYAFKYVNGTLTITKSNTKSNRAAAGGEGLGR